MTKPSLEIISMGVYLPPDVRTNDWWPPEIVASWSKTATKNIVRDQQKEEVPTSRPIQLALQAMTELKNDPFKGTVERRIRPANMRPSEMEISAARDALSRAGLSPSDIGLLLVQSQGPDSLLAPNATLVHRALGVPAECMATSIEAGCNGFSYQLSFAANMLQTGAIRYALLVQSTALNTLHRTEDSFSPWFGEGATAVVVGPASGDYGLLAQHHEVDGDMYESLLVGHPDGRWYDGFTPRGYVADFNIARRMAVSLPEMAHRSITNTLQKCGHTSREIGFLASHQPTKWLRRVIQEAIDAPQARSCDTFTWTAGMGPCNIPLCIALGEREGLIRDGDLVVGWGGGSGITHASFALRWRQRG